MDKLEALPSIARLSDNVIRVLGQNPGKFTLQGTNTYIIGARSPRVLLDTGEGRPEYIPILESALRETAPPSDPAEPDISDIIVSHWHHDHIGGLPDVLALLRRLWDARNPARPFPPPRLHKFPLPAGTDAGTLPTVLAALPTSAYTSAAHAPFHDLSIVAPAPGGLRVLHTPGHTLDSVCLYVPADRALFTADTVLGQGTAVFADLALYIASLRALQAAADTAETPFAALYPGHGPVVADGLSAIRTYIAHRLEREEQIVKVLASPPVPAPKPSPAAVTSESPPGGHWTTWSLVARIYAAYPEALWAPAAHGVDLHLRKLEGEGRVHRLDGEGVETHWELVS